MGNLRYLVEPVTSPTTRPPPPPATGFLFRFSTMPRSQIVQENNLHAFIWRPRGSPVSEAVTPRSQMLCWLVFRFPLLGRLRRGPEAESGQQKKVHLRTGNRLDSDVLGIKSGMLLSIEGRGNLVTSFNNFIFLFFFLALLFFTSLWKYCWVRAGSFVNGGWMARKP